MADVLRPGSEMVAAGYTMYASVTPSAFHHFNETCRYGSSANLVLSTGSGVNGYTLDASLGEFILTHPNVSFPNLVLININRTHFWIDHHSPSRKNLLV